MNSLSDDLPPKMISFIQQKVNSFVKWEILRFLRENPEVADTHEGMARFIGCRPDLIDGELREMAEAGLLEVRAVGEQSVYSLTNDAEVLVMIDSFLKACEDRIFRLKAIYYVAQSMR